MIKLIVAVDNNFGIGYKNDLLFKIPEDLKRFKKLTKGHYVVMGRKTFESLPNPLPERTNVVITRNINYKPEHHSVIVECDITKIINHYLQTGEQSKDIWVIGGAEIYKAFLPYADEIQLTMINKSATQVDTYFPMNEVLKLFQIDVTNSESQHVETEDCDVTFYTYKRIRNSIE